MFFCNTMPYYTRIKRTTPFLCCVILTSSNNKQTLSCNTLSRIKPASIQFLRTRYIHINSPKPSTHTVRVHVTLYSGYLGYHCTKLVGVVYLLHRNKYTGTGLFTFYCVYTDMCYTVSRKGLVLNVR